MDNDRSARRLGAQPAEVIRLLAAGGVVTLGGWGATLLARIDHHARAGSQPGCVVRPELEEGPFFVDAQLNRSDASRRPPRPGRRLT